MKKEVKNNKLSFVKRSFKVDPLCKKVECNMQATFNGSVWYAYAKAVCKGDDHFNESHGRHIAETKCRRKLYKRAYRDLVERIEKIRKDHTVMISSLEKYAWLLVREFHHLNELKNENNI